MHHSCCRCASHLSAPQRQSVSARATLAMLRSSARCLRAVSGHLAHHSRSISAAGGSSVCRVQRLGRFDGSADRRAPMCLGRVSCFVEPRGTPCATATRTLHVSSRRSAPPALLWLLTKPLQKLVAMILGRSLRKWWQGLPQDKRTLLREWASRNRGRIAMVVLGIGGLSVAFYVTHLDETPLTGRRRLLIFSSEQLTWLSEMEYNETMEEYKDNILPESHAAHRAVALAVQQLVERNQDVAQVASTPWTVSVVDLPKANAYVLPNGQIFVFTGMLEKVANADQLGIVLGHEMAHAVLGHAAEKASFLHFIDFFSLVFITIIWAVLPRDWLSALGHWAHSQAMQLLLDMPYSRQLEREADEVGLKLAAKACFDVRASVAFWEQMHTSEEEGVMLPEWLSTHPSHEQRAAHLQRLLPEAIKLREACNCPALASLDPRLMLRILKAAISGPGGRQVVAPALAAVPILPVGVATIAEKPSPGGDRVTSRRGTGPEGQ
ncbi:metalloendopeptidase OMA1, mitochondrial isoform X1 [Lampetra fluviatilis]